MRSQVEFLEEEPGRLDRALQHARVRHVEGVPARLVTVRGTGRGRGMLVYATSKVYPLACSAIAASSHCIRPLLLRCGSAQPVNLPWASHVVSPCRTSTCVRAAACDEAPVHTREAGSGVAHESAAWLGSTEAAEQTHCNRALARRAARPGRGCRPGREHAAAAGDHEECSRHLVRYASVGSGVEVAGGTADRS